MLRGLAQAQWQEGNRDAGEGGRQFPFRTGRAMVMLYAAVSSTRAAPVCVHGGAQVTWIQAPNSDLKKKKSEKYPLF